MAQIDRTTFDLVIIDLVMPVQEGLETIRALNREHPSLRRGHPLQRGSLPPQLRQQARHLHLPTSEPVAGGLCRGSLLDSALKPEGAGRI